MKPNRDQVRLARMRDHYLWSLTLDGRERIKASGVFEICGPLPPECYAELMTLVDRWIAEGKV